MVSTSRNNIFLKYWAPSNSNNAFKENLNENVSFLLNRKSINKRVRLSYISTRWKNCFQ